MKTSSIKQLICRSFTLIVINAFLIGHASLLNAAQIVTPDSNVLFVDAGSNVNVSTSYTVSSPETADEVGLGLRIHFDSSKISFNQINSALEDSLQPVGSAQDDLLNHDNDTATDKFVVIGWIDYVGNWPSQASLPTSLFDASYAISQSFSGTSTINFTASSTSGDASFESSSQLLCRKPEVSIDSVANSHMEGDTIDFTVRLDEALPAACGNISIDYTLSGTAVEGTNYNNVPSSVTFQAGQQASTLSVETIDNPAVEDNKTITLTLSSNAFSNASTENSSQTTELVSNDAEVSISIDNSQLSENDENNTATITITRSGYLANAISVNFTTSGTATVGQDVNLSQTSSVNLPSNQASATVTLSVIDDSLAEDLEQITVSLSDSADYQLSGNNSVTASIADNDDICTDIDGNGSVDALTDGLTLTRYLMGLRGDALTQGTLSGDALRTTPTEIENFIEGHLPSGCYDIDGSSESDALTDGLILIRYLVGYRGSDLVTGVLSSEATRTTGDAVGAYIESII